MAGRRMLSRAALRTLPAVLAATMAAQNRPSDEQRVLVAYRQMEEADRHGDGQLWFSLRDRKTLDSMDAKVKEMILKGGRARPSVQYDALAVRVRGSQAVLAGKVSDPPGGTTQYATVLFTAEDREWKVAREQWSDRPFDPFVLSAWLPPEDGTFLRDGAPWKGIAYAPPNTQVLGKLEMVWKIQATMDESFLYVRFEANAPLLAPGAKLGPQAGRTGTTGGLPPPPPMRVKILPSAEPPVTDPEYVISVTDLVSTHRGFDTRDKAESNYYSVAYALLVKNGAGQEIFESTIGEDAESLLLAVEGRFIDVKFPLNGLGVENPRKDQVEMEEADAVFRVLPFKVEAYTGK
jgi:hypothetical protein